MQRQLRFQWLRPTDHLRGHAESRPLQAGTATDGCCMPFLSCPIFQAGTYTVAFPGYCLASSVSSAASLHPSWVIRQLGPAPWTTRHPAQTVSGSSGLSSISPVVSCLSRGSFASSCGACAAKLRATVHRTVRATARPGKALSQCGCRMMLAGCSVRVMSCVLPRSQTLEHVVFSGSFLDSAWSLHG